MRGSLVARHGRTHTNGCFQLLSNKLALNSGAFAHARHNFRHLQHSSREPGRTPNNPQSKTSANEDKSASETESTKQLSERKKNLTALFKLIQLAENTAKPLIQTPTYIETRSTVDNRNPANLPISSGALPPRDLTLVAKRFPEAYQRSPQTDYTMGEKRPFKGPDGGQQNKKYKKETKRNKGGGVGFIDGIPWADGSNEEILRLEVQQLIKEAPAQEISVEQPSYFEMSALFEELELKVTKTSSTGDGLALDRNGQHVYAIPFAIPGDTVIARPYLRVDPDSYSRADFVQVLKPSPLRDDSRVGCKHFAACGGCQFQMMLPEDQLEHKKTVLQDAYAHFSNIDSSLLPELEPTLPSPLQYGYRTKLTPHFDGPPGFTRRNKTGERPKFSEVPPIGFMLKGRRKVIDIEDCPIGSEAVRFGMKQERKRVASTLDKFSKGATILLRETTERKPKLSGLTTASFAEPVVRETDEYFETKDYVTDNNASVKEYVGDALLINNANSFFQNNNSILPSFIAYIKERLFSKSTEVPKAKYLVDAYCGSGLFTITLASLFQKSIGVDIDPASIQYAKENATRNNLPKSRASFMTATASEIFQDIDFPASETVMVIDPPRKGCDLPFLKQLMTFGPQRIVYVSCNVHSQARDVGFMVNGIPKIDAGSGEGQGAYAIESLRGCDFFPQTAHVEGVAILQRKVTLNSKSNETNSSKPEV
jgi:tRNA (uracil-5-)-methyltransferase